MHRHRHEVLHPDPLLHQLAPAGLRAPPLQEAAVHPGPIGHLGHAAHRPVAQPDQPQLLRHRPMAAALDRRDHLDPLGSHTS
jgi:hypothetical protein